MAWLSLSVDPKGLPCRELGQQRGALKIVETPMVDLMRVMGSPRLFFENGSVLSQRSEVSLT